MNKALHLTLALLVLVSADALAAAETENGSTGDMAKHLANHVHRFDSRASQKFKDALTLPDVAETLCGAFRTFAGKETKACFTRSAKGGKWESFIIDLNRNQDLTDDPVLAIPGRSLEKLTLEHEGKTYTFNATAYQNRSYARLSIFALEGSSGSLLLNGEDVAWIACDCNLSGKLDAGDTALLDMNGDGKYSDRKRDATLAIGPDSALFRDNAWHCVTPGDGNSELAAAPYSGKLVKLTIDQSKLKKAGDTPQDISLYTPDERMHNLPGVVPSAGVNVPAGTFTYVAGSIKTEPKALDYYVPNVNVEADTVLTLEPPESTISVSQSGGKINVGQKMVAEGGFSYRLARGNPGPLVEIFSEATGDEPITKGNMAYG